MTQKKSLLDYDQVQLRFLKSKNDKVKSQYIHFCEENEGRERSLVTFTVPAIKDKGEQLLNVKEIKNYFAKRLQNLKSNVQYFFVIELGKTSNNPHLHAQLFYEIKDKERVDEAYMKTVQNFKLNKRRCKLSLDREEVSSTSTHNYIIKEYDNKQLTNDRILELNEARNKLKQYISHSSFDDELKTTKYIQFYSKSRPQQTNPIYKKLWFDYGLTYNNVNELFKKGYAEKYKIDKEKEKSLKFRERIKRSHYPYIRLKKTLIKINTIDLYHLILFVILFSYQRLSSKKYIYWNKRVKKGLFMISSNKILYNFEINRDKVINNGYERIRYRDARGKRLKL